MSDTTQAPHPKSFPWRTLLIASAALNVALIGGLIGTYAAGARLERPVPAQVLATIRGPGQRAFMEALEPQTRRVVRRALLARLPDFREPRQRSRAARVALLEIARQDPYNSEATRAAFADVRAADAEMAALFHDIVADVLEDLPPEQRRDALNALARHLHERPPPPRRDQP